MDPTPDPVAASSAAPARRAHALADSDSKRGAGTRAGPNAGQRADSVTAPDWGDGPTGGRRRGLLSRRLYVQAIIWFTVLFVLGMTALIWHRWSSVSLPTANIIPLGDESVEGAEATVSTTDGSGEAGETKGSIRLEKKNSYTGVIWLVPGLYKLTVKLNDRVISEAPVNVAPMHSVTVFVSLKPRAGATTAPTAPVAPATPAAPGPAPSTDRANSPRQTP